MQNGRRQAVGAAVTLCALADISDPGGKGFHPSGHAPLFVIRRGRRVFGYANICPHQGTQLDWKPDTFLTLDKALIQCSTHGAQFQIHDGTCIAGPCVGRALTTIAVRVDGTNVVFDP